MRLTADGTRYTDDDGVLYDRVSSVVKMVDYVSDGLVYAGASMAAKRAAEIVKCAVDRTQFPRPSVVAGEPATILQDPGNWPDMVKWLSGSPAAEMEKARNRGAILDMLAVRFASEGHLRPNDAASWAVDTGIGCKLSFDEDDVGDRAAALSCWWAHVNLRPVAWQIRVYSPEYLVCGTFDMLAEIDDEYYLLDWKGGTYQPAYKMQTVAYRRMERVDHPDEDAIKTVLQSSSPAIVAVSERRVQFRPVQNCETWWGAFLDALYLMRALSSPEDSRPDTRLSHTMDEFETAEALNKHE